jgi:hypothetical protein
MIISAVSGSSVVSVIKCPIAIQEAAASIVDEPPQQFDRFHKPVLFRR